MPRIPIPICWLSGNNLKVKLETRHQRPFAGQLRIERERIQAVILVGDVQKPNLDLPLPMVEAIANVSVELPEIVAGNVRRVAAIGLLRPDRIKLTEETRGRVVYGEQVNLMK